MGSAEDWLKSGASLLSVYEKQKLMGFTDQEIATIFEELKDEMMAKLTLPNSFSGWSGAAASPPPPPDPKVYNDDRRTIKIVVAGKNCKLAEGSDLHLKIKDLISWLIINAVDNHNMVLNSSGTSLDNLKNDRSLFNAIENLLSKELMTAVKIIQVDAHKRYDYANPYGDEEIVIGVALTLNQEYIDSYTDIDSDQLIHMAMRDLNGS